MCKAIEATNQELMEGKLCVRHPTAFASFVQRHATLDKDGALAFKGARKCSVNSVTPRATAKHPFGFTVKTDKGELLEIFVDDADTLSRWMSALDSAVNHKPSADVQQDDSAQVEMAKVGDTLPDVQVYENDHETTVNIRDVCKGKTVIVIAVPGAFTPLCSKTHLPGYVKDYDNIKAKGVDEIIAISVNDPYVMKGWGEAHGCEGKVRMLADTHCNFTKAMGTELPATPLLGNTRSLRYSMIVKDNKIEFINVEPDGMGVSCSLSNVILDQLPLP